MSPGRLFFALWPSEEAARSLATLSRSLAEMAEGKAVPIEKMHVTVAFLGQVDAAQAQAAAAAASEVEAAGFLVTLDRVGSFSGARVAWAGAEKISLPLARAQAALAAGLASRGFELDDRPFVPHVTLARHIRRRVQPASIAPIAWKASELTLVRTEPGRGTYTVVGKWGLRGS